MGEFDIDVTELDAFAEKLRGISNAGPLAFTGVAQKYRDLTMEEARRIVPVDTGLLRSTIQKESTEASNQGLSAGWKVTARHASPIEYGFVHYRSGKFVPAQPYVRPALAKYRKQYIEDLATAAKDQFGTNKGVTRPALNKATG